MNRRQFLKDLVLITAGLGVARHIPISNTPDHFDFFKDWTEDYRYPFPNQPPKVETISNQYDITEYLSQLESVIKERVKTRGLEPQNWVVVMHPEMYQQFVAAFPSMVIM